MTATLPRRITLGYDGAGAWQNFERAINEAKAASQSQGYDTATIFSDITKKSPGAGRPAKDYRLTRSAMTPMELAVVTFAENVTAALHQQNDSHGFGAVAADVDQGAGIAREKRLEIEEATGQLVVSPRNMIKEPDGGLWAQLPDPDENP